MQVILGTKIGMTQIIGETGEVTPVTIVLVVVVAFAALAVWRVFKKGAPCECGGCRKCGGGDCHCGE